MEEVDFNEFSSRTALPEDLAEEIRNRVFSDAGFVRITMVRHQGIGPSKETFAPVSVKGETVWQAGTTDGKQVRVRNHAAGEPAKEALEALLSATGAREYHLVAASGDLHVRITRKGRPLVSRGKPSEENAKVAVREHDREKDLPLNRFDSSVLLRALGMTDGNGSIRASMRGKVDQVNSFLREIDSVIAELGQKEGDEPFGIVDCGCGRAYLTIAAYCYLTQYRGMKVRVCGIDRNKSVIATARSVASSLDAAADVVFESADLADCSPGCKVDLVLSLHACDTATDAAIARGVEWGARAMLIAPCCQHDLQGQMGNVGPMRALLRHGILRERLADLLTDAFRAQMLRIMGYKVRVLEFVSHDSTPRNIMLRAVGGVKPGQAAAVSEYVDMRDTWKVVPALERILGERLSRYLR